MFFGHQKIVSYLESLIKNKNVVRNYLFLGPSGVGKNYLAKQFAKAVLCENFIGSLNDFDEIKCPCQSCFKFDRNIHQDFIYLVSENNKEIGINSAKEIKRRISFKPISSFHVVLVNQAHLLTDEAANAMLKIVEEPDSRTIFIFTADYEIKPTLISRMEILKFNLLGENEIREIFEKKGSDLNNEIKENILYLSGGRPGILIELIRNQSLFENKINLINDLTFFIKSNIINKIKYIENYIKNDRKIDEILNLWLKVLVDYLEPELEGNPPFGGLPLAIKKKIVESGIKQQNLIKIAIRALDLKELNSRYNLNGRILLEQLAIIELK